MADASRDPTPAGWDEAFAALPLESPPASRWPQLAARLDAPARRARSRRHWLALAAGLCALAALPLAWTLRDGGSDGGGFDGIAASATAPAPRIDPPGAARFGPAVETPVDTSVENPAAPPFAATRAPTPSATDTKRNGQRDADRVRGLAATTTVAETAADVASAASRPHTTAMPQDDTPERALESLYAASTQLETLLALTRDTRVESGPAAALAGALDAELATIDAQLAQPGLEALQQQALWQARVDTLRQATDFETQQRVLSAQGRSYEGALVRVD